MDFATRMMQQELPGRRKLLLASTITLLLWTSSSLTLETPTNSANSNNNSSFYQVPGLYPQDDLITPIQGHDQFERLVRGAHSNETMGGHREHQMSLVQFYMATCPDCQGFSPYFKRFVGNIAPHWRRLVRIFVVNCNDDLNINLCWRENPGLVVPMVRWYTLPALINLLDTPLPNGTMLDSVYSNEAISKSHRTYIKKQRRDLISLRHATLGFMSSIVDRLEALMEKDVSEEKVIEDSTLAFYRSIKPIQWRHLQSLGRQKQAKIGGSAGSGQSRFGSELEARQLECRKMLGEARNREMMLDFIVFERQDSYLGKTLVADWSNHSCGSTSDKLFMVHYSNELSLLGFSNSNLSEPQLYSIETKPIQYELKRVAIGGPQLNMRRRRRRWAQLSASRANQTGSSQQRLLQRMSLEQYYSKRRPGPVNRRHPTYKDTRVAKRRLRRLAVEDDLEKAKNRAQLEAENINWAPAELYSNEELLRRTFNRAIAREVLAADTDFQQQVAGWAGGEFGEIKLPPRDSRNRQVVAPKDEDLSLVSLTDYYKVLGEILHKNFRQRFVLDGYQFLGAICFTDQLGRHFPFQGLTQTSHWSRVQSHIQRLRNTSIDKLEERISLANQSKRLNLSAVCSRPLELEENELAMLSAMNMSGNAIQRIDRHVVDSFKTGVPDEGHFKWAYCAGSSPYLRGHTCSLWLLFHTLTVHEYLESNNTEIQDLYYKFVTPNEYSSKSSSNQSSSSHQSCDPAQPEAALLGTSSRDLFVKAPQFALANIINFVRYFMSCTNCAAHFSCMVERSMDKLDFKSPQPGDHLLFLWEAHNRVNQRTKNTHSEDPNHPKHIFPTYDACPACYLEKPPAKQVALDSLSFNKQELVKFLVARYRRSAIINNKIHIEDLINKTPATTTTTTTTPSPAAA